VKTDGGLCKYLKIGHWLLHFSLGHGRLSSSVAFRKNLQNDKSGSSFFAALNAVVYVYAINNVLFFWERSSMTIYASNLFH